ncbi:MAG TPA: ferritin-like domain-containing protein [Burkholderiaceae bacterium]
MPSLRHQALRVVQASTPAAKVALTRQLLASTTPLDTELELAEPPGLPGRPSKPVLRSHVQLKQRSLATVEGRAGLIHSICHIEFNAIDLALDVVWRFAGMPADFYRDWIRIASEEALHFSLLREHLQSLGFDYGDFEAHNALWDMAERTKGDPLARLGLVPRTLEARGLDASPAVKNKLVGAGDHRAGEILDIILRDEIGHVAAGNRWYRWLCEQRGLDPISTYAELVQRHDAPRLRGPFNLAARRQAGFTEDELGALG